MNLVLVLLLTMCMAHARRISGGFGGSFLSRKEDCLCQCIPLQYNDMFGIKRGNCENTFQEGKFCYVVGDSKSPCVDLKPSTQFMGKYISKHACLTPHLDTFLCKKFKLHNLSPKNILNNIPMDNNK
nr:uncharacterized protein LOC121129700 [Lepeophtheirus salmonis]